MLNDNDFSGSLPFEVCALRENNDNESPGQLVADCAGETPKVECDCCTSCTSGGEELPIDLTEKLPINLRTSNGTP